MKRRDFLRRFIPTTSQEEKEPETVRHEESSKRPAMTENELFLYAMAQGIDPATITPGQLEELVSSRNN
ncbi:MAG: hypothetical protein MI749_17145 [Desulfovibrionales bacterium]|nr:hypothetical protein [Desulfovibrionales bacterium]